MREALADLWTEPADARCITTNGYIKSNGALVMGAGVAGQAQSRYPKFPKVAGEAVAKFGNHVFPFTTRELRSESMFTPTDKAIFITFPVKHKWYEAADLDLIVRSAHELQELVDKLDLKKVLLPRPGCGNGRLSWDDVKPAIDFLDDRIVVVTNQL